MSRLDELIKELCPDGVPYMQLKSITYKISDGMHSLPKGSSKQGAYPILSAQNVNNGTISIETNKWVEKNVFDVENKRTNVQKGDVLLTIVGAIGRTAVVSTDLKALFQRSVCVIKPNTEIIVSQYLSYVIGSSAVQSYMQANAHGAAQKGLYLKQVGEIKLPVPPLEVQNEIVRILDNFTELTDELTAKLTAELTARQKQYEFYRDKLLDFGVLGGGTSECVWKTLAELGKWSGGKTPSMAEKAYWTDGTIPWISSKDMKASTLSDTQDHITEKAVNGASMTVYPANSIAIVTRSGILKHTFPVAYVPFETTVNQDIKMLVVNDEVLPRYAFHVIQGKGKDILVKTKKQGGTVDSLDFQKVLAYKVPVPSKDVQSRLVKVLDNFDAICSDLNIGLPAEIEARQKQYEYYRDMLLTFAESGNTISRAERSN